jgi:hypothetical protein
MDKNIFIKYKLYNNLSFEFFFNFHIYELFVFNLILKGIPYAYVKSRMELGAAAETKKPTSN